MGKVVDDEATKLVVVDKVVVVVVVVTVTGVVVDDRSVVVVVMISWNLGADVSFRRASRAVNISGMDMDDSRWAGVVLVLMIEAASDVNEEEDEEDDNGVVVDGAVAVCKNRCLASSPRTTLRFLTSSSSKLGSWK